MTSFFLVYVHSNPEGGGAYLMPKRMWVCPRNVTMAVGASMNKRLKKKHPYGCNISKKGELWVQNLRKQRYL